MKNVLALLICSVLVLVSFTNAPRGYKVGDKVKDFTLKGIDDKNYSLSSFSNAEGYVIVFTSNVCAHAKKYEQRLMELHQTYAAKGFHIIAINSNDASLDAQESVEAMRLTAKMNKLQYPYLVDEGSKVAIQFGVNFNPQVYVLDKNAVVQYIGAIDDNTQNPKNNYLEAAILSVKDGKAVEKNKMPVQMACPMKKKGMMEP